MTLLNRLLWCHRPVPPTRQWVPLGVSDSIPATTLTPPANNKDMPKCIDMPIYPGVYRMPDQIKTGL
jgi:hypothetical protein